MFEQADVSHLIEGLNPAQREAVCAPPGNMLVLAGAGSGKTRVLIHRIAWLVEVERMSPQAILAVTFTNKAANEMRQRLHGLLKISTRGLWVGTFHGLAHKLLRIHWKEANLPENFQILDSDDQYQAVRRVLKNMELDEKAWPPKQARGHINQFKDQGLRPDRALAEAANDYEHRQAEIYQQYQTFCERGGLVDFAELLLRNRELWKQHPEILAHYRRRFHFLLVDEFQDTNGIQYEWLRLLADQQTPVFVVGDDDQSIYSWRGAESENLNRFQRDFAPVSLVRLEQNYRSTETILGAANALISHNRQRLGKELWTDGGQGEPIALYRAYNDLDEARFVVGTIRDWVEKGGKYGDCGILYRSNAQSRILEETLLAAGIAYRVHGGLRFFERAEIKDALAYLRLIANPHDDTAFERVINTPARGMGQRSLEIMRAAARADGVSLWQATQRLILSGGLSAKAANSARRFQEMLTRLAAESAELSLPELTRKMLENSQLIAHYQKEKGEKGEMRVENLGELINATRQIGEQEVNEGSALNAFLSHAALESGEQQSEAGLPPSDCVQLMTLHAAKGLEFPLVFLCGMEEQLFPHRLALQDANGLEEERRLCYVGMTRAMRRLYLSHAEVRRLHGNENYSLPSRFLGEIPATLLQEVRLSTPRAAWRVPPSEGSLFSEIDSLMPGQRVLHPKFGEGVILEHEGSGEHARVYVYFEQQGKKWLMLAHTQLQPLSS